MTTTEIMQAEARAARAAGDAAAAALAWRRLLDQAPNDWEAAFELKRDLLAMGMYADGDARFRRAAQAAPDPAWLDHYAGLHQFHAADLPAIEGRAQKMLERGGHDARPGAVLGQALRQRRKWAEAAAAFEAAERLAPGAYTAQAAESAMYGRLAARAWKDEGPEYVILVVNLARNAERMAEIGRQFAEAINPSASPLQRVDGVEGTRLSADEAARLTGCARAARGTLGCFLGHRAAWSALLASGRACALVVEDDVIPLLALPARLGGLGLPEGWELAFVNDRLAPKRPPEAVTAFEAWTVARTMRAFHPEDNAPGGDGYLLTRAGARKLLEWVAADGMAGDVDWRLLAYSLSMEEAVSIKAPSHARTESLRWQGRIGRRERLRGYAVSPALIRTVGVSSDREDENRADARRRQL